MFTLQYQDATAYAWSSQYSLNYTCNPCDISYRSYTVMHLQTFATIPVSASTVKELVMLITSGDGGMAADNMTDAFFEAGLLIIDDATGDVVTPDELAYRTQERSYE